MKRALIHNQVLSPSRAVLAHSIRIIGAKRPHKTSSTCYFFSNMLVLAKDNCVSNIQRNIWHWPFRAIKFVDAVLK